MIRDEFKAAIKYRIYVQEISDGEWDEGLQKAWNLLIDAVCKDIDESIEYIKNECTADEFSYLSEVMEEIAEKTQSQEFIDALYETAKKYPEETERYNILPFIQDAEELIEKP